MDLDDGGPVNAVSPAPDRVDIFTVEPGGRVMQSTSMPGDASWAGGWKPALSLVTDPRTLVGAVSRSRDKLDLAAAAVTNGVVSTAARVGSEPWRGWWPIRPSGTLANQITGMSDPRVNDWKKVGTAFKSENSVYSEEAQGITADPDGEAWFLTSNTPQSFFPSLSTPKSIRRLLIPGHGTHSVVKTLDAPTGFNHVGAAGFYDGWVYVALQGPLGVWKVRADLLSHHTITPAPNTDGRLFGWCDVNPLNGRLYTSISNQPGTLEAYDRNTLERRWEDDIVLNVPYSQGWPLGPIQIIPGGSYVPWGWVQGGVFTRRGRFIMIIGHPSQDGWIYVFSAVNGVYLGHKRIPEPTWTVAWEQEGATVRPLSVFHPLFGSRRADVHVLELDNDYVGSGDDVYLRSYSVPEPEQL